VKSSKTVKMSDNEDANANQEEEEEEVEEEEEEEEEVCFAANGKGFSQLLRRARF
jgi:hypothetical protein